MEIKMSRFDNSPWGFRVHGGIDFGAPLRIQKVSTILAFLCAIKALALASKVLTTDLCSLPIILIKMFIIYLLIYVFYGTHWFVWPH